MCIDALLSELIRWCPYTLYGTAQSADPAGGYFPLDEGLFVTSFPAWLWRRPQRWFLLGIPAGGLIAFLLGIGFTGGFLGGLKYAETDSFCTSCHEMRAPYQEFTQSVH